MGEILNDMTALLKNNMLVKLLSIVFGFLVLISSLVVAAVELLKGEPINRYLILVLGTGIGFALHAIGYNTKGEVTPVETKVTPVEK